jgi:uncharacterized protein DUF1298
MLKHIDFLASDVPGFPGTVYLCGVPVKGYYAFSPTIGAAFNATLFSYRTVCCVGVNIDTAAVPDDDVLVECLREGFAEVVGAELPPADAVFPTGAELPIASGSPPQSESRHVPHEAPVAPC